MSVDTNAVTIADLQPGMVLIDRETERTVRSIRVMNGKMVGVECYGGAIVWDYELSQWLVAPSREDVRAMIRQSQTDTEGRCKYCGAVTFNGQCRHNCEQVR